MCTEATTARPPRRPAHWRAPGPAPLGPQDRPELHCGPEEDLAYLCGDWRIFQPQRGHRWSTDDLLTAWFARQHAATTLDPEPAAICDLGCGLASVLMLLAWAYPKATLYGVEAQADRLAFAHRSVAYNGVAHRCRLLCADLRALPASLPMGGSDLVTGTPPYWPPGTATPAQCHQAIACRFETRGGIEAYCQAAAHLLSPKGLFVTCEGASLRGRTLDAGASVGLQCMATCEVIPKAGKDPLFSLFAFTRRDTATHAAPPRRDDDPHTTLVIRDARGQRTAAYQAVRDLMGLP